MALTNSDQENVLLPSDEENPSAPPPPRGWLPIKARLAVGLCLAAAGLAGAAVMRRQATHAPPKIKRPWADTVSLANNETGAIHWSEECNKAFEAIEKEAKETRRQVYAGMGQLPDCKDSEQTCRVKQTVSKLGDRYSAMCFPAICKQENILKTFQEQSKNVAELEDVDVTCAKNGAELEEWRTYLSQECHDRLEALEKEAEESGRNHATEFSMFGEVPVCKDDQSEGICTFTFNLTFEGMPEPFTMQRSQCFPAICKQENIQKGTLQRGGTNGTKVHCVGIDITTPTTTTTTK